jgi:osmotically inducible protein OsmC
MVSVTRSAKATWSGSHKDGSGALSTQSGTLLETPYAFDTRFLETTGTNPEELIAAAHAGCFNMSLAYRLIAAGYKPDLLTTPARLTLSQDGTGWHIARVALDLEAVVPGLDPMMFSALAEEAKLGCAVSRSLKADVSLTAALKELVNQSSS